jgi:hypothetical protein
MPGTPRYVVPTGLYSELVQLFNDMTPAELDSNVVGFLPICSPTRTTINERSTKKLTIKQSPIGTASW